MDEEFKKRIAAQMIATAVNGLTVGDIDNVLSYDYDIVANRAEIMSIKAYAISMVKSL